MRFNQGISAARAVSRWLGARGSVERAAAVGAGGLLLTVGSWVVAPSAPVCASCIPPPGQVFWTWPADGTTDANPAEGLSLMAFDGLGNERPTMSEFGIWLNDEPVVVNPDGRIWGPIPLDPDTDYALRVELVGAPEYRATFRTTAARPLPATLPAPEIASIATQRFGELGAFDSVSPECLPVFVGSNCYDDGPPDLVDLTLARDSRRPWPDDALIFHTREVRDLPPNRSPRETWLPGSVCQPLNVNDIVEQPACAQVRYRTPDGRYSDWSAPFCEGDDESGCAAGSNSPGSSLPGVLVIVAAFLIGRRRAKRG